jgi:hypothetical protein
LIGMWFLSLKPAVDGMPTGPGHVANLSRSEWDAGTIDDVGIALQRR